MDSYSCWYRISCATKANSLPSLSLGVAAPCVKRVASASRPGSAGNDSSRMARSHRMNESHDGSVVTTTCACTSGKGTMLGSEGSACTSSRVSS